MLCFDGQRSTEATTTKQAAEPVEEIVVDDEDEDRIMENVDVSGMEDPFEEGHT